jgi:hypothetical protein
MFLRRRRLPGLLACLTLLIVLGLDARPARAQFGMGMGWGWGGIGAMPSPSTTLLNDHAIARTAAAAARMPGRSHSPYANNPNSYLNRVRDNGFVSHSDVRRRRPPAYRTGRAGSIAPGGQAATAPAAASGSLPPVVPLASFFDAAYQLVWPNESPSRGELKPKREAADVATLAVLKETKQQGWASVTSVTEARYRLVEYGQPALQEIRAQATPPIADAFHRFLLSLYDSLTDAASMPEVGH